MEKPLFTGQQIRNFWDKVDRCAGDGCWLWMGATCRHGYGSFGLNGTTGMAHRISWMMSHGELLPKGQPVLHTCDVPACVRPDHLWLGTQGANMKDMADKGRSRRGLQHHNGKLTDLDVIEICDLYVKGVVPTNIANKYKVSVRHIRDLILGKKRKHVTRQLLPSEVREDIIKNRRFFSKEQISRIRAVATKVPLVEIAKKYGVSPHAIGDIVNRKTYKDVN